MASTDAPDGSVSSVETLGPLTPATQCELDKLVLQSNWNQTADDWAVFSRLGTIAAMRDSLGHIVASGAVLPMGDEDRGIHVAWISMILVAPSERGRGLGRRVFEHCLQIAKSSGKIPMLDATPQGEPLYRQFGFAPLWRLTRWRREAQESALATAATQTAANMERLMTLDRAAFGCERSAVLEALSGRDGSRCVTNATSAAVVRAGRVAHHIGPLMAAHEAHATQLLQQALDGLSGPVLIDVPDDRQQINAALERSGFQRQRGFARMACTAAGQEAPQGQTHLIHAIAGPEFG